MSISQPENTVVNDPETSRRRIADELGLSLDRVTDAFLTTLAEDPLFLCHLEICRADPEMLDMLLAEGRSTPQVTAVQPTTVELLSRASAALARWAASGFSRVGPQQYQKRLSVCQSCEHLSSPPATTRLYRFVGVSSDEKTICKLCGCNVRKKAWLATEQCPDARWDKEEQWQSRR